MSSHNTNAISSTTLPLKQSMGHRTDRPDVETEYTELQRQYRIVESEKKSYTEKTQIQLKKLEAMVEKLQEDNTSLRHEIKNLDQRKISFQQNTISPKVAELSEKISKYAAMVETETNRLQQLENESSNLQQRIKNQQDLLGGIGLTQIEQQTHGYIKILENRLQNALSKYSETVAATKKIRNEIESKKREKQVFDRLARRREKDILDRKKRMSKIVEESNYAYEARDDLQNKMFSIRERMVKEVAEYEEQVLDMGRTIEQEELKRAEIERAIAALGYHNGHNGERGSATATATGTATATAASDADQLLLLQRTRATPPPPRKINPSSSPSVVDPLLADYEMQISSIDDQIKKYEEFFTRLSPLVGELSDPAGIVDKITGDEFQKFSRFNFINETYKQCDALETSIHALQEELSQCKRTWSGGGGGDLSGGGGDSIRIKLSETLQQQLEDTEKKTEKFESKAAQCLKVFSVKEGIHDILDRLGDYRTRDLSMNELNETNIWRLLETISMALAPHLTAYIHLHSRESMGGMIAGTSLDPYDDHSPSYRDEEPAPNNKRNPPPLFLNKTHALLGLSESVIEDLMAPSSLVQIDPPTTGYDSTDSEDQIYPFSSEEMRWKLSGSSQGGSQAITRDTATPSRHRKHHHSPSLPSPQPQSPSLPHKKGSNSKNSSSSSKSRPSTTSSAVSVA